MRTLLILSLVLISFGAYSQGGAQIFAGLSSFQNTNIGVTNPGELQYAYTVGIQSRLKDGTFVAGPGLKYTRLTMLSHDDVSFFNKSEHYHLISMPLNVGLEYRLMYLLKLRMYTGADMHYFWKIDDNDRGINFNYVNDYFFGAHAGIGLDISWVTFDVIYERGLSNAHQMDDSKYNSITATIGIFF